MEPAQLEGISLFAGLEDDELGQVAAALREVEVEAGETLASQGERAFELYVIEEGDADVIQDGEPVSKLHKGDFFGEIGLLATGTRTASVVATTPMRLLAMFSRDFQQIERKMPAVAEKLREAMRERVARTSF
jgi:CRP-like cAMP-binding protein